MSAKTWPLPSRLPSGPIQGQGQTLLAQGKAGKRLQGVGGLLGERPRQGRPGTLESASSSGAATPSRPPSLPGERLHSLGGPRAHTPGRIPAATLGRQASLLSPLLPALPSRPPSSHTPTWLGRALVAVLSSPGCWPSGTQTTTLSSGFLFKSHDWPLSAVSLLRSTQVLLRNLDRLTPPTGSQQLPLRRLPVYGSLDPWVPSSSLVPRTGCCSPRPGALRCQELEPGAPGPLLQPSRRRPCAPEQA